mmetsp:Transcript_31033/g.93184  ORF Transcript_31033/g.93184 Transcript_31033/m.93184 type:complete len:870 (+) Transcript_31033:224-2833(+)
MVSERQNMLSSLRAQSGALKLVLRILHESIETERSRFGEDVVTGADASIATWTSEPKQAEASVAILPNTRSYQIVAAKTDIDNHIRPVVWCASKANQLFEEIVSVYGIDSCEMSRRYKAVKLLGSSIRGWLVQSRRRKLLKVLLVLQQHIYQKLSVELSASISRCHILDLGTSRLRRRHVRKSLYKHWMSLISAAHDSLRKRSAISPMSHPKNVTEVIFTRLFLAKIISMKKLAFKNWHLAMMLPISRCTNQDLIALVDAAIQTASLAFENTNKTKLWREGEVVNVLAIVKHCWNIETSLLRAVFTSWHRWIKSSSEGRLALAIVPEDGREFSLKEISSKPLKPRFSAPHDVRAAARISRGFRLRRCTDAWHSRTTVLAALASKRRHALTKHIYRHLLAWREHANKLQSARQLALNRWCAHVAARTSGPLQAWYVWAHARKALQRNAFRVVSMFTHLKRRHIAAATLRAWRHAAELSRLEARYTRRQLMGALAEQKSHIRRLEKCVDDHDLVRAQLERAAEIANERAAKLVRYAAECDDDCKRLEDNLMAVETSVAMAQRCLSSVETVRSALMQHVLQMQPGVGFIHGDLAKLARDREARAGAGMSTFKVNRGQETINCEALPEIPSSVENQDDGLELPKGMALVCHPNISSGLLLCRTSEILDLNQRNVDVIKTAIKARLKWLLTTRSQPIDFYGVSQINDSLLTQKGRERETDGIRGEGLRKDYFDVTQTAASDSNHRLSAALCDMPHDLVDEVAVKLVTNFKDMYGVFDFLRDGDNSTLCSRLTHSWNEFCQAEDRPIKGWRKLAEKTPIRGLANTWAGLAQQLSSRMPNPRLIGVSVEKLAVEFVSSQCELGVLYRGNARYLGRW